MAEGTPRKRTDRPVAIPARPDPQHRSCAGETRSIDCRFLEQRLGAVYDDDPAATAATRLMAGLAILKSMPNLSDGTLCKRRLYRPTTGDVTLCAFKRVETCHR